MMESINFDPNMLAGPFVLGCCFIAFIAWLAMLVGSLKLSLALTTKEAPGYLHCLVMLILIMIGNVAVLIGMYVALGPQPWYVTTCYQVFVQIGMMMIVARCNPFSAFFATLCHTVFSSMGTIAIALAFLLFCGSALTGAKERKKQANSYQSQPTSSSSWFSGSDKNAQNKWGNKPKRVRVRYTENPFIH